ncbi:MAG: GNAT family N-acetyltransferase [Lentisphaeria bacterium]|nr:GNAT family N-acetyltransferase [Lentisphaeria bacterium]
MSDLNMRSLNNEEQSLILPLLGECFSEYWEQLACRSGKMPYYELSFAAFDGDKVVGHCGVIPYRVWCGGVVFPMAGVASVAVTPAYRNRGIAGKLCAVAVEWAKKNNFVSMPLFTAHTAVYEGNGFREVALPDAREIASGKRTAALSWSRGRDLTDREKENIIRLYRNAPSFNGKVMRDDSGTLHSWERIFAEPEFRFAAVPKMYAVKCGDTIIELAYDYAQTTVADRKRLFYQLGAHKFFLPESAELAELLDGVDTFAVSSAEVLHGEKAMALDLSSVPFHQENRIFFPVTDKF